MDDAKVKKTTIVVEVLSYEEEDLSGMSLEQIGREMDYGLMVGTISIQNEELLDKKQAEEALYDMGSDPSFFEDVFNEDDSFSL